MREVLGRLVRSLRIAVARAHEPELAAVWKFGLGSLVCFGCAVLGVANVLLAADPVLPTLLASGVALLFAVGSAAYVVHAVRGAGY